MPALLDGIVDGTAEEESLARLLTLVSPLTGLVQGTTTALVSSEDARLHSVACQPADLSPLGAGSATLEAGATKPTARAALVAALGEAVERYGASVVSPDYLVVASADDLGPQAVDPERFALFSEAQYATPAFPFEPFTRQLRTSWIRGVSLTGDPCWLPADLVFLADMPGSGHRIGYATSSGLACGPTQGEAILSAFLELLERDAFMVAWHARLSLPRIDVSASVELREFGFSRLDPSGARWSVIDLSSIHNVPTALALVRGAGRPSVALAVGAAAGSSARLAWIGAVCEAFAVLPWARALRQREPERRFSHDYADVTTFADHVHLYAQPEHARHADFLGESPELRPIGMIPDLEGATVAARIDAIVARLGRAATSGYVVDVTTTDAAAAGLHVIRALAPELCALNAGHATRFLGGRRLCEAPWQLGLRSAPVRREDLNPYPHPFP